tara:strand:+ start:1026 stop:3086 length:2061 start_codon:yes stop_codon:yes gene_type:complete
MFLIKLANIFLSSIKKENWEWTYQNPYDEVEKVYWNSFKNNYFSIGIDRNEIWFRPKVELSSKWYFLSVFHQGLNQFAFGKFRFGQYGYHQCRLMRPGKRRFRVIKNKKGLKPIFLLSNLQNKIEIKELTLYSIPSFYSWIKIIMRFREFQEKYAAIEKKNTLKWKIYNSTFYNNLSKNIIISYSNWIKKIEFPSIKKYLNSKKDYSAYFTLIEISKLDYEYKNDWVIPIRDNSLIPDWGFYLFYKSLRKNKNCKILYTDEDYINKFGKRYKPNFKSSWNREFFISNPNYGKFWIISSKIWNKALEQSIEKYKTRNFRIVLLICIYICEIEKKNKKNIYHLPIVGHHLKKEFNDKNHDIFDDEYKKFLFSFINKRWKKLGKCESIKVNNYKTGIKLSWAVPKSPLLSILIPSKDNLDLLKGCIDSIFNYKSGLRFEIIVIDNNSKKTSTYNYYKKIEKTYQNLINIIYYKKPFNYSKINNFAFEFTKGDVLLFLNNDIEFICNNWALELYSNAIRPEVGCVGAKLIYPNKTIQHAGIVLGISGTAGHAHKYLKVDENGYQNRINLIQEVSAVTGAAMAIKKDKFKEIGMFDEEVFKVNFNDVDLCLRAMNYGLKNIYIPEVLAIHHESATRRTTKGHQSLTNEFETISLINRWGKILKNDPFYSPYLTLLDEDFSLSYRNFQIETR